jgi:hypothetical protein
MTEPMNAETRVRISPSVYVRAFGDELVLLDFGRGEYFGLDAVGSVVWRALEQGESLGSAAERVARDFAVSREEALTDIVSLVGMMREAALVSVA